MQRRSISFVRTLCYNSEPCFFSFFKFFNPLLGGVRKQMALLYSDTIIKDSPTLTSRIVRDKPFVGQTTIGAASTLEKISAQATKTRK
jgi:hypothetical protein